MAAQTSTAKGGSGLGRKVGPLPLWALIVLGALAGWFILRRVGGQSSATTGSAAAPAPSSYSSGADQGLVPAAGSSGGASTGDLVSTLGGQQQSLIEGLISSEQNVVQLAQAQQSSLLTTTATAPVDTSGGAAVQPQPGGSNAPQFTFVFPRLPANTQASTAPASKVKTAPVAAKTSPATKYFTYKRQVPLKSGQTVHFAHGKGYYAG